MKNILKYFIITLEVVFRVGFWVVLVLWANDIVTFELPVVWGIAILVGDNILDHIVASEEE